MYKSVTTSLLLIGTLVMTSCSQTKDIEDLLPPRAEMEIPDDYSQDIESPRSGNGTEYYVSMSKGDDSNDGTSESSAFKTIQKAAATAQPGDIVTLMGTFTSNAYEPILWLKKENSGTEGNYITWRSSETEPAKIQAHGNMYNGLALINASYVIIDGIEFIGNSVVENLTLADARAAYDAYVADNNSVNERNCRKFNVSCLSIGGLGSSSQLPTHVAVRNCKIHDFPSAGLGASQADYIWLENNEIWNNCWYCMYATSGISILYPYNSDANTGYKIIIQGNRCYRNMTQIPWITTKELSDGNGIIIDVNRNWANDCINKEAYNGRTLIRNNVSYYNGGSGIHTFESEHVDVVNNTLYMNARVIKCANMYSTSGDDVFFVNNIVVADENESGAQCTSTNNNKTVVYDYNIYFGGTTCYIGDHDRVIKPLFVNACDDLIADFHLTDGSAGIDGGTDRKAPAMDKDGNARPAGAAVDCGAYENK